MPALLLPWNQPGPFSGEQCTEVPRAGQWPERIGISKIFLCLPSRSALMWGEAGAKSGRTLGQLLGVAQSGGLG